MFVLSGISSRMSAVTQKCRHNIVPVVTRSPHVPTSRRLRLTPASFQPAWLPTLETIHESDRKKRVMINQRFEDADKDGNGRINMEELRSLLEHACCDSVGQPLMKHWLSEEEVARVMKRYDTDGSGDLAAEEFQHLVNDGLLLDEKLSDFQAAFAAVDTDNSGDISAEELHAALVRLGWPQGAGSTDEVVKLMGRYGVNDDGTIDFPSFMSLMKDIMLDVREVLSYLGARPESPSTSSNIIHAVAYQEFSLVTCAADLEAKLSAAGAERLVLLMAGTTWCTTSRALVQQVKVLAEAYPAVRVLMLWGNVSTAAKELFKDQLKVRSTPAFFMFKGGDLVCHWAGGDACEVEAQIRRRLPADADLPAQPVLAA